MKTKLFLLSLILLQASLTLKSQEVWRGKVNLVNETTDIGMMVNVGDQLIISAFGAGLFGPESWPLFTRLWVTPSGKLDPEGAINSEYPSSVVFYAQIGDSIYNVGDFMHFKAGESGWLELKIRDTHFSTNEGFFLVYVVKIPSNGVFVQSPGTKMIQMNNYPNPMQATTTIQYDLQDIADHGYLVIYNNDGTALEKHILNEKQSEVKVNTSNYIPGIYYYQIHTDYGISSSQKMIKIE